MMLFIYILAEPTNGSNGSSALLHALLLFIMPMCKELTNKNRNLMILNLNHFSHIININC